jgi:tRNA(Ile)-lysidine synthase
VLKLKEFIKSNKPNLSHHISDDYYLQKSYNVISFKHYELNEFSYTLDKLEKFTTPYFKIVDSGLKMEGVYVSDEEFPITIRNYRPEDKVMLKEGSKKVSRLFIDKKIPMMERKMIPIIENKNHEIIFVYKIYRKYGLKYVKNNLFMIK